MLMTSVLFYFYPSNIYKQAWICDSVCLWLWSFYFYDLVSSFRKEIFKTKKKQKMRSVGSIYNNCVHMVIVQSSMVLIKKLEVQSFKPFSLCFVLFYYLLPSDLYSKCTLYNGIIVNILFINNPNRFLAWHMSLFLQFRFLNCAMK